KKRPLDKAIPRLVSDTDAIQRLGSAMTRAARSLARQFWPGALTIVVKRRERSAGEPPTIALRMPNHPLALSLIAGAGGSLAVTSANISGGPNCSTPAEVLAQLDGRIAAVVDGGSCSGGIESTIVDATEEDVLVLRPGAI